MLEHTTPTCFSAKAEISPKNLNVFFSDATFSVFVCVLGRFVVCWSLTSLCHSNGHIETMPAREINPFTALTRIRSKFLRTQ